MMIARKANAWRLIVTHFSPRYAKIAPVMDLHMETKTLIAFDHMRFEIKNLEWAYSLVDIYRKLLQKRPT